MGERFQIDFPEKAWSFFQTQLQTLVSKIVPTKKTCTKSKPWFNVGIKSYVRKNIMLTGNGKIKSYQNGNDGNGMHVTKHSRKKVVHEIKHAKIAYHHLQIQHLSKEESRPFWSEVKGYLITKKIQVATSSLEPRN